MASQAGAGVPVYLSLGPSGPISRRAGGDQSTIRTYLAVPTHERLGRDYERSPAIPGEQSCCGGEEGFVYPPKPRPTGFPMEHLPAALRQFRRLKDLLGKELGLRPAPETVALYEEIARADVQGDRARRTAWIQPLPAKEG